MTMHQSVKQSNLAECRQALYDQIRLLRIKCLGTDSAVYAHGIRRSAQNQNSWIHTFSLSQNSQIVVSQKNRQTNDL